VVLFNGEGGQVRAHAARIGKRRASAESSRIEAVDVELPFASPWPRACPKAARWTGLSKRRSNWAFRIQPLAAQRSRGKLSAERAEKKMAHWEGMIVSASEQSGRNRLAALAPLQDFKQWIAQADLAPRILLSPRATQSLAGLGAPSGPAGGDLGDRARGRLQRQEEERRWRQGALALAMGPRVLRTETAGWRRWPR
jgi:16S rRNA (uracil1498-N3)-methyltransferase